VSQVRQLVAIAALSGRAAVLPSFACSAPWLHRAASGHVDDLRVVPDHLAPDDRGGRGGGRGRGRTRCAPCNVQFGCRRHVLSERQWRLVERQHDDLGHDDEGDHNGDGDPGEAPAGRAPDQSPGRSRRDLEVEAATAAAAVAAGNSLLGRRPRRLRRERRPRPLPLRPPRRPRNSSTRRGRTDPEADLDLAAIWSRDEIDLPAFWAQLDAPDRGAPRGAALGAARVLELASLAEVPRCGAWWAGVMGGRGGREQRRTRHAPASACACACMQVRGGWEGIDAELLRRWPRLAEQAGPSAAAPSHSSTCTHAPARMAPRPTLACRWRGCTAASLVGRRTGEATRAPSASTSCSSRCHTEYSTLARMPIRGTATASATRVSTAAVSLGATARGTRSVQVHKWRRRRPPSALRRDVSPLSARLGFRCADLMCSEEPCSKQAPCTHAPWRDVCTCARARARARVCVCARQPALLRRACTRPYRSRAASRSAGRIALCGAAQHERGAA
jgi:hypothetical protein